MLFLSTQDQLASKIGRSLFLVSDHSQHCPSLNLEVDSTQIVSPAFGCGADAKDCKTSERQTDVLLKPIFSNSGKRLLLCSEKEVNSLEPDFNLLKEASKLAVSGRVPEARIWRCFESQIWRGKGGLCRTGGRSALMLPPFEAAPPPPPSSPASLWREGGGGY